jgi:hypothetical protein
LQGAEGSTAGVGGFGSPGSAVATGPAAGAVLDRYGQTRGNIVVGRLAASAVTGMASPGQSASLDISSAPPAFRTMLAVCLRSTDVLFHDTLYRCVVN